MKYPIGKSFLDSFLLDFFIPGIGWLNHFSKFLKVLSDIDELYIIEKTKSCYAQRYLNRKFYIYRYIKKTKWLLLKIYLVHYMFTEQHRASITTACTMKLWHWKSHWKFTVTLKNLGTKGMSNAENFSVWFKTFQCDFSVLEQQRKIFQWDNPGLSLWFPL